MLDSPLCDLTTAYKVEKAAPPDKQFFMDF